jgi:predicted ester cyclase
MLTEGDRVAYRWTAVGTHQGELLGVPPSGNRVELTGITVERIEGTKIAETWNNFDQLGMMRQIGAVTAPEQGEG